MLFVWLVPILLYCFVNYFYQYSTVNYILSILALVWGFFIVGLVFVPKRKIWIIPTALVVFAFTLIATEKFISLEIRSQENKAIVAERLILPEDEVVNPVTADMLGCTENTWY